MWGGARGIKVQGYSLAKSPIAPIGAAEKVGGWSSTAACCILAKVTKCCACALHALSWCPTHCAGARVKRWACVSQVLGLRATLSASFP